MEEHDTQDYSLSPLAEVAKRSFDITAALVGMVVFAPVCLLIYIAIKCEDKGNAIFSQERIGYGGRPFMLYKFRSMRADAEADGKPHLCVANDARLTRVGKFLREHHLDEFPQLWNVLRGDMSIVGPRPERRYFINEIMAVNPDYELLYNLRPGLFSEATLYNGYTDTMEKMQQRLRMDLRYLHNRTFWEDLRIVFITVMTILLGKKF